MGWRACVTQRKLELFSAEGRFKASRWLILFGQLKSLTQSMMSSRFDAPPAVSSVQEKTLMRDARRAWQLLEVFFFVFFFCCFALVF